MTSPEISEDTIKKIADLARLQLTDQEVVLYSQQLGGILDYVSQLSKLNTDGIEPLVTATDMRSTIREDEAFRNPASDQATANAPDKSGNLFKVPPVL